MPQTKTRVVGSGFTTFNYNGKPIAFMDEYTDSGQKPLGMPAVEAIFSLDKNRAIEIVTSRVLDVGTLTLTIRELWNEEVWQQLSGLEDVEGVITDVFAALAAQPEAVTCQTLVKPPGSPTWRGKTYHNCIITDIQDGETVSLGRLTVPKAITVTYTHKTYLKSQGNNA
jgi:hypothetical protein